MKMVASPDVTVLSPWLWLPGSGSPHKAGCFAIVEVFQTKTVSFPALHGAFFTHIFDALSVTHFSLLYTLGYIQKAYRPCNVG